MPVDLTLDPDTIRMFADRARAINAMEASDEDEKDVEGDLEEAVNRPAHHQDTLAEEEAGDLTREELTELIDDLNEDEAQELVAIVWIGRNDFEASDWELAREEARQRAVGPTSTYLLGMPLLADFIEAGLDALEL